MIFLVFATVGAATGSSPMHVYSQDHLVWFIGVATVFATLMGPILAVQAQKALEFARERQNRKVWVFTQLMMTRQQRLSPDHVRALNLIDVTFYGYKVFGIFRHRSDADEEVINAWKTYRTRLVAKPEDMSWELWGSKHTESFFALLKTMAIATGYKFADAELETSSYAPQAYANREAQEEIIRDLAVKVLHGDQAISLNIAAFPEPNDAGRALQSAIAKLGTAVDDAGIKVVLHSIDQGSNS
ncbi:MAG: DUF6680 family protein [Rhodanobacter sp.]